MKEDCLYEGEVEVCAMCYNEIFLDSYSEEYKWIDGLGYLCSNCMSLNEFCVDEHVELDINDIGVDENEF